MICTVISLTVVANNLYQIYVLSWEYRNKWHFLSPMSSVIKELILLLMHHIFHAARNTKDLTVKANFELVSDRSQCK
jgi:hypothetical protein